ncbi:hypothetical protein WICPIJ_009521 [Wickerhamomyces pijperi]|uniref:Uncharacterized protein n=1 Tax=Wickerhamomyces pijperi TaxID=599730 RepID=A0A9P8PLP2_WICPI|nr:hypothetical protein WICPIJ_009521 [Wickerhamomyces pijperi]
MLWEAANSKEPTVTWILTVWSNLVQDLSDLRFETHIQHSVSFIQDQVSNSSQVGLTSFQHINQSTWSSDTNFRTSSQVSGLLVLWNTTVDTGVSNSGRSTKLGTFGLDLDSQFSGWGQDQDNWTITSF